MKFDKETAIKHHFWGVAGGFLLVFLIAWLIILFSASPTVKQARENYEKATKILSPYEKAVVNEATYIPPWNNYEKVYRVHKDKIWASAWEEQKSLFTWPGEFQRYWDQAPSYKAWLDGFVDPEQRSERLSSFRDAYRAQFKSGWYKGPIINMVYPVEFKDGEVGFERMMLPAVGAGQDGAAQGGFGNPFGGKPDRGGATPAISLKNFFPERPTLEEAWLAQEDFLVKKEMLEVVLRTIENLGDFKEVAGSKEGKKNPDPAVASEDGKKDSPVVAIDFLGRNAFWEVHLIILKDNLDRYSVSPESTIKNIDPSRHVLAVGNPRTKQPLRLVLLQEKKSIPSHIDINMEPLAPDMAARPFGEQAKLNKLDNFDAALPFTLSEDFEWANCPIKRIDDIRIGAHSHRTCNKLLIANKFFQDPEDKAAAPPPGKAGSPPPAAGGAGAAPGGGKIPGGPMGNPQAGGGGGGDAQPDQRYTSANNLDRYRYLHINGQCRHMPVGMVVVMDQDHLHELLSGFANSLMRFQITQVQLHHVTGIQSLAAQEDPRRPDQAASATTVATPTTPPPPENDLVEVSIYGIVALYERYSPDPASRPGPPPKDQGKPNPNPPGNANPTGKLG